LKNLFQQRTTLGTSAPNAGIDRSRPGINGFVPAEGEA
jgi:hypothetical protein